MTDTPSSPAFVQAYRQVQSFALGKTGTATSKILEDLLALVQDLTPEERLRTPLPFCFLKSPKMLQKALDVGFEAHLFFLPHTKTYSGTNPPILAREAAAKANAPFETHRILDQLGISPATTDEVKKWGTWIMKSYLFESFAYLFQAQPETMQTMLTGENAKLPLFLIHIWGDDASKNQTKSKPFFLFVEARGAQWERAKASMAYTLTGDNKIKKLANFEAFLRDVRETHLTQTLTQTPPAHEPARRRL